MGDLITLSVKNFAGEILRFADDQREGGTNNCVPAFFSDVDEAAPHNFKAHRIGGDPVDSRAQFRV